MSTGTQILLGVLVAVALFGLGVAVRRRRPVERRPVSGDLTTRLRDLVADGKTIVAIKELRQEAGMGLREAKEYVLGLSPEPRRRDVDRVHALAAEGKPILAIKELRERTGMSLREAKEYVDRLTAEPPPPREVEDPMIRVRDLAAEGRKIHAIKELRQHTGMSLREAKKYVDGL